MVLASQESEWVSIAPWQPHAGCTLKSSSATLDMTLNGLSHTSRCLELLNCGVQWTVSCWKHTDVILTSEVTSLLTASYINWLTYILLLSLYIQYPVLPLTRFTFVPYCAFNVLICKKECFCVLPTVSLLSLTVPVKYETSYENCAFLLRCSTANR